MIGEADPRCIVCRGSGIVDAWGREESCPCVGSPRRDPNEQPKPGWVGDALSEALATATKRHAEHEEHRLSCTAAECDRCGRFACGRCQAPAGLDRKCEACRVVERDAARVERVRATVPKRFRWTFNATPETLLGRVKASGELISRGLAHPPAADLVFFGDTGTGKTSLAVAMFDAWLRQAPEDRRGARFVESYWLAGTRARHPLGQGEAPEVLEAMGSPMLVIDDLGSEVDDRRNVMADVIFHRHNEELPTWITTGFSVEQLIARYGSAVMRRILETGKRVTLGGPKP